MRDEAIRWGGKVLVHQEVGGTSAAVQGAHQRSSSFDLTTPVRQRRGSSVASQHGGGDPAEDQVAAQQALKEEDVTGLADAAPGACVEPLLEEVDVARCDQPCTSDVGASVLCTPAQVGAWVGRVGKLVEWRGVVGVHLVAWFCGAG